MTDVDLLWAMLGVGSGFHEIRSGDDVHWVEVDRRARFCRLLRYLEDAEISACPRSEQGSPFGDRGMALWARTSGGASQALLRGFEPRPTLVLQEGATSRYVAFWALTRALSEHYIDRANRRLAHALGSPKKCGDPGALVPAPGSGRWRTVFKLEELYTPRQVVGRLREAPDPWTGWKEAA